MPRRKDSRKNVECTREVPNLASNEGRYKEDLDAAEDFSYEVQEQLFDQQGLFSSTGVDLAKGFLEMWTMVSSPHSKKFQWKPKEIRAFRYLLN
jgi:hypothetical protein